jgi:hypothetical protein
MRKERSVSSRLPARFWVQISCAVLFGIALAAALIDPEWIEAFGIDPDNGSGALEWGLALALGVLCVAFCLAGARTWRRARAAGAA